MNRENADIRAIDGTTSWMGPMTMISKKFSNSLPCPLDVVLITHPRDEDDLKRMFPWIDHLSLTEKRALSKCLRPMLGEIIRTEKINIGLLFMTVYAREMIDPILRGDCRRLLQQEALDMVEATGAKIVCLGGLTGALTHYGKQLLKYADEKGITITTGHSVTAISVYRTYLKAIKDLHFSPSNKQMTILGLGSIGGAFAKMLLMNNQLPETLVLIDKPNRGDHLRKLAEELSRLSSIEIKCELTSLDGTLSDDSEIYRSSYIISAVSNPNVIDISKVAPGTVLIDDSQPYCWPREEAMKRCLEKKDIAPCEAGLIDCANIGYVSHFPFDFSDHDESGSRISWSCLSEGLIKHLHPELPNTLGEPDMDCILQYDKAFTSLGLKVAALQCGKHELPVHHLRKSFENIEKQVYETN